MTDWTFDLVIEPDKSVGTLVLSGESDPARAGDLAAAFTNLFDSDCTELRVDLSEVSSIDTQTLEAILRAHETFGREGRPLGIANPSVGALRAFSDHPGARHLLG